MKRFLLYLTFFLLPILSFILFGDGFISSTLKKSNSFAQGEYTVWNDIYSGKASSDILIYGSSRAWVHIDPTALQNSLHLSAYNFGVDGHNFTIQDLRHKEYLRNNKKPKVIIYSLDVFTLFQRKDLYNLDAFLPYLYEKPELAETLGKYEGFDSMDFNLPCVRYFGKKAAIIEALKTAFLGSEKAIGRVRGFESKEQMWDGEFENKLTLQKSITLPIDSTSARNFEQFINECSKNDIKLLFVYTPEYYKAHQFVANRSEILNYYQTIARKDSIPFLDFSEDEICKRKEDFYNAEHMNKAGTKVFNKKLCNIILNKPKLLALFETSN